MAEILQGFLTVVRFVRSAEFAAGLQVSGQPGVGLLPEPSLLFPVGLFADIVL